MAHRVLFPKRNIFLLLPCLGQPRACACAFGTFLKQSRAVPAIWPVAMQSAREKYSVARAKIKCMCFISIVQSSCYASTAYLLCGSPNANSEALRSNVA